MGSTCSIFCPDALREDAPEETALNDYVNGASSGFNTIDIVAEAAISRATPTVAVTHALIHSQISPPKGQRIKFHVFRYG